MMNIEEIRKRHDQDMLNYQHGRQLMVVGSLVSFGLKDRGVLLECIAELEAQLEVCPGGENHANPGRWGYDYCPNCGGRVEVSDG